MSVSRKCPHCKHWNTDRDYCERCNTNLNTDALIREKEQIEIRKKIELNTDRIDRFIAGLSKSETPWGKLAYYVVRTVWCIAFMILTFIYAIIALIAG